MTSANKILPLLLAATLALPAGAAAQRAASDDAVPDLAPLVGHAASEMVTVVERFGDDRAALARRYDAPWSAAARERLREFYHGWRDELRAIDFESLDAESRIDWVLLDGEIRFRLSELDREDRMAAEMADLVPFTDGIVALHEARRDRMVSPDPRATAETITALIREVEGAREAAESAVAGGRAPSPIVGMRAADAVASLGRTLDRWYEYYAGYDPMFTWWNEVPYGRLEEALTGYGRFLRERVVGQRQGQDPPIVGDPIGADGMAADLRHEMIPYSPEELIAIAEKEYAYLEGEMIRASRELGFGDDWLRAVEHVKTLHVEPGEQTTLVRDLALEAIEFVESRDLVTVPELAKEVWRMEMLSPERQKVSPFFLGGETFWVSYPTHEMEHADKLMSMRGNNPHFSRAVAHHELIPGHHLQGFMAQRYNAHRRAFSTPFWNEGNALYWEMRLWELGFPRGPEDRVGMLFWRMHRAARIIFSLSFHLGRMTPQEAIDFLVERVGHERANAEAEVRRSFNGSYPPLYQAAYMLGGIQFRALHRELVESGRMTEKQFHDAILRGGSMPVEMVRARLTGQMLQRDHEPSWRFAGDPR